MIAAGDLADSPLLRDVTNDALLEVLTDVEPISYLDDGGWLERPHHWEVATKLKVLGSKPVRAAVKRLGENPRSFVELEKLLLISRDQQLDAAIIAELKKYHFAEKFVEKVLKHSNPGAVEKEMETILERIQNGAVDDAEVRTIIWLDATIHKQLEEDEKDRRREYKLYTKWYTEQKIITFGYLADLQKRLLGLSVDYLNAKTRELNTLIPESQRRGMKPGPPAE